MMQRTQVDVGIQWLCKVELHIRHSRIPFPTPHQSAVLSYAPLGVTCADCIRSAEMSSSCGEMSARKSHCFCAEICTVLAHDELISPAEKMHRKEELKRETEHQAQKRERTCRIRFSSWKRSLFNTFHFCGENHREQYSYGVLLNTSSNTESLLPVACSWPLIPAPVVTIPPRR
eukprot:gnl/TRDRNA2_/TRDRNA2_50824_c0_seq1.p1 gnl/TRDRNA2_/TRDRNA2_50824_c0~~gnl/TRDRNA2_/TRDRNA2_50824_c0_seq1.p1  ORF type:complete len:174 (+),score=5.03 gnl/TRDRNA2_/TRDRNA2_50824_c0_seq1:117-638(+)